MSLDVLVFYVPVADTDDVLAAIFAAGGGRVGDYEECAFIVEGRGQFLPGAGAHPAIGEVGELEHVMENRVEVTFPRRLRGEVVAALRESHPYEEPAFHVLENVAPSE
ncbi:MAG: hypothetical protein ACTHWA_04810 [Arachnia sp.]